MSRHVRNHCPYEVQPRIWLVVGFEDEASYRANAEDPRTDEMARNMQQLMSAPPEWHDGEIVSMTRAEDPASA